TCTDLHYFRKTARNYPVVKLHSLSEKVSRRTPQSAPRKTESEQAEYGLLFALHTRSFGELECVRWTRWFRRGVGGRTERRRTLAGGVRSIADRQFRHRIPAI